MASSPHHRHFDPHPAGSEGGDMWGSDRGRLVPRYKSSPENRKAARLEAVTLGEKPIWSQSQASPGYSPVRTNLGRKT